MSNNQYLHPIKHVKVAPSNYQTISQGTTAGGVKLKQISTVTRHSINQNYHNGIMAEMPDGSTMTVFGSGQDISDTADNLKNDPEAVFRKLRIEGQPQMKGNATQFYLNRPAPTSISDGVTAEGMKQDAVARKLYPSMTGQDAPLTSAQIDAKDRRQHSKDLEAEKIHYNNSPDLEVAE